MNALPDDRELENDPLDDPAEDLQEEPGQEAPVLDATEFKDDSPPERPDKPELDLTNIRRGRLNEAFKHLARGAVQQISTGETAVISIAVKFEKKSPDMVAITSEMKATGPKRKNVDTAILYTADDGILLLVDEAIIQDGEQTKLLGHEQLAYDVGEDGVVEFQGDDGNADDDAPDETSDLEESEA